MGSSEAHLRGPSELYGRQGSFFLSYQKKKKGAKQGLRCERSPSPVGLLTPPVPSAGCDFGSKPWPHGPKGKCLFQEVIQEIKYFPMQEECLNKIKLRDSK